MCVHKTLLACPKHRGPKSHSPAEAPYGKFLNNAGFGRARGKRWEVGKLFYFPLPAFPARYRFFLSPGLRPRSLYGQSNTKEAFAEERGPEHCLGNSIIIYKTDALWNEMHCYLPLFLGLLEPLRRNLTRSKGGLYFKYHLVCRFVNATIRFRFGIQLLSGKKLSVS